MDCIQVVAIYVEREVDGKLERDMAIVYTAEQPQTAEEIKALELKCALERFPKADGWRFHGTLYATFKKYLVPLAA